MGNDEAMPRSLRRWLITILIDLVGAVLLALVLRLFNDWSDAIASALAVLVVLVALDAGNDISRRRRRK